MSFPSLGMVAEMIASKIAGSPNKTITLSGDSSGSGTAAITVTLATVNSDTGSINGVTTNSKGLVTANVAAANLYAGQSSPGGTTSSTGIMSGLGSTATITPVSTGRLYVSISGTVVQTTSGDESELQARWGTGGAPSFNASPTGTNPTNCFITATAGVASQRIPFSMSFVITGLALGTAVWLDIEQIAVTGTTTLGATQITAFEI